MKKNPRALKPEAQGFDEIRLVTVPRYKTSGLSGDEWRISVVIQFFRKGRLICEDWCGHKMEDAVAFVAWKYADANGAFYAGEEDFCDQEGCAKKATVVYRLKKQFCNSGHEHLAIFDYIRMFCDEHKTRGDCGLEDADRNYELLQDTVT